MGTEADWWSRSETEAIRDSVPTEHPEQCGGERTDRQEDCPERGESVREPDRWRAWKGDHVHEGGDCGTDPREHPAQKEREVRCQFCGHDCPVAAAPS